MMTIQDIFDAFDGPAKLARVIGVKTEHAAAMRRRNSIPVRYWRAILDCVEAKGGKTELGIVITQSDLLAAHLKPSTSKDEVAA